MSTGSHGPNPYAKILKPELLKNLAPVLQIQDSQVIFKR